MQTVFLPYPDFRRSAKCLSDDHLRAQRTFIRNAIQAVSIPGRLIRGKDENIDVWRGHITQLLYACEATLDERRRRGSDERGVTPWMLDHKTPRPAFLDDPATHAGHRAYLLRATPAHYGRMGWVM